MFEFKLNKISKWTLAYLTLSVSLMATLGSLYFSEIEKLPPCLLCWYQRIFMYPLVLITLVGILLHDRKLPYYILPLSIIGLVIASYHVLLQAGIVPESSAPCILGVSCTTEYVAYFGFITIPLLSFTAFFLINVLMLLYIKINQKETPS